MPGVDGAVGADEVTEVTGELKVERAYRQLRQLIVTLALPPGEPIDERQLMARLDIGRTPLREAILRLTHERLIVHSPRRGAWVSELSIIDLHQMIEARTAIEPLVVRRATEHFVPADRGPLEEILRQATAAFERNDIDAGVSYDLAFHSAIARLGRNSYFASFSDQINTAMLRYWHVSQRGKDNRDWLHNHQELLDSVAGRDPRAAEQQALEHISVFRERIRDLVM